MPGPHSLIAGPIPGNWSELKTGKRLRRHTAPPLRGGGGRMQRIQIAKLKRKKEKENKNKEIEALARKKEKIFFATLNVTRATALKHNANNINALVHAGL